MNKMLFNFYLIIYYIDYIDIYIFIIFIFFLNLCIAKIVQLYHFFTIKIENIFVNN